MGTQSHKICAALAVIIIRQSVLFSVCFSLFITVIILSHHLRLFNRPLFVANFNALCYDQSKGGENNEQSTDRL
jgi:hypothetical protein